MTLFPCLRLDLTVSVPSAHPNENSQAEPMTDVERVTLVNEQSAGRLELRTEPCSTTVTFSRCWVRSYIPIHEWSILEVVERISDFSKP